MGGCLRYAGHRAIRLQERAPYYPYRYSYALRRAPLYAPHRLPRKVKGGPTYVRPPSTSLARFMLSLLHNHKLTTYGLFTI